MSLDIIRSTLGTAVPTKPNIHLFVVLGSSMSNGYSSDWNQAGDDKTIYFDDGEDVNGIWRFDTSSDSNQLTTSAVYKPILLNSDSNAGTRKFSNCWYAARDMVFNSIYGSGEAIAVFERSHNNTSIINGEGVSWSPSDATGHLVETIKQLKFYIKYLEGWGYNVIFEGVNMSNHVIETTGSTTQSDYATAIGDIITELRTEFADWIVGHLPFVWDVVDGITWVPQSTAYRAAVLAYSDTYFDYFDLADHMKANDTIHPRTITVRNFGKFLSSRFYTLKNGVSIPTASSVSVNGTLQVNKSITANYTYADADGDAEGNSEIHVEYADDNSGTNKVTMLYHVTGNTQLLIVTQEDKYIRVGVVPISASGKVGKIAWSTWGGPVISA